MKVQHLYISLFLHFFLTFSCISWHNPVLRLPWPNPLRGRSFVQTVKCITCSVFQLSVFGGSAWRFDPARGQYYYHAFLESQIDLNYRNPRVMEEMKVGILVTIYNRSVLVFLSRRVQCSVLIHHYFRSSRWYGSGWIEEYLGSEWMLWSFCLNRKILMPMKLCSQ